MLILALVAGTGLALGQLRVRGLGLGIAGVLFAGLAFGHFGVRVDERILEFAREFGLILFVYSIGLQVGPGFVASLRRNGLPLNLLAAAVVLLGVLTAVSLHLVGGIDAAAVAGILSGATTNTPSLAAAQQALEQVATDPAARETLARLPGVGYAVAYPFGVFGIIVVMVGIRAAFRISLAREREELERSLEAEVRRPARANLEVANPNLAGMSLERVPLAQSGIVVSRILHEGTLQVPRPDTKLALGDVLLAIGTREELDALRVVVGKESDLDLRSLPSALTTRRLIVTRAAASGKTIAELDFVRRFGVQITRVSRAEVELPASPGFELQYGDSVLVVGEAADIAGAAPELGDSPKSLNYPHLVPMFVGIALGILLGRWAFSLPGVPAPVRLGLAGGPLLVAILLSRIGRIGRLVWYMPLSANYMLREVGIVLFLCAVGLHAGDVFVDTLLHGPGLYWMAGGALVTVVPLAVVGVVGRVVLGLNFLTLSGLLAGSMTDPPALAFANTVAGSEGPSTAYATVYPATMILRVLAAQLFVLYLVR
ncbi:MAG TPA: putative transporter [Vicinamibacteria bacterium]|nr:putative transporter [Vicinamibacteria bacterium]